MLDAAFDLRRTGCCVGTVMGSFSFDAHQGGATFGTIAYESQGAAVGQAPAGIYTGYFGDDFTPFFHADHIVQMQIESRNDVGIMQGGSFYSGSGQRHRFEVGYGSYSACATHLKIYRTQAGEGAFGFKLIADGPTGCFSSKAQFLAKCQTVDFNNYPVNFKREFVAGSIPVFYEGVNFFKITTQLVVG